MAKETALTYTRSTGEQVACGRDGRDFVVSIDGEEVHRNRMTIRRGETAMGVATKWARVWRDGDGDEKAAR